MLLSSGTNGTNLTQNKKKTNTLISFTISKHSPEDDQSILIEASSCNHQFSRTNYYSKDNLFTWCHRKQSLLILFTMQSYKSYYMVSPQTVFTYHLSPCKATNLTTWCHRKQSLLILFTVQSYKSYYMVSPQTVFTYPLLIFVHSLNEMALFIVIALP